MNWSVGVCTVPQRRSTLLPRTLASLRAAGFEKPLVLFDGEGTAPGGCLDRVALFDPENGGKGAELVLTRYENRFSFRDGRIGALANWLLGLHELWLRNPRVDRYLMVQDDVVFVRSLRQYLEREGTFPILKPGTQYLNLYNFSADTQEEWYSPAMRPGFYLPGHQGKGALALVFDNPGVQMLLRSPAWADAILSETDRAHKRIDGTVSTAFRVAKGRELVHWPSLCQHVGEESTLGNPPGPTHKAPSFPGEDFNALEWLK